MNEEEARDACARKLGTSSGMMFDSCVREEMGNLTQGTTGSSANARSEYVPWATVPVEEYGVTVPKTNKNMMTMPSTDAQVDAVNSGSYDLYNFTGIEKSLAPSPFSLPVNEQKMIEAAAKSIHPQKTLSSYYTELVDLSYDLSKMGIRKSPQQLAYEQLMGSGGAGSGGSGGGGGGSAGPTKSINRMTEPDIREMADNMAMQFIGRTLDDKEFNKIVKGQRKAENKNPTVSSVQGDTRVTEGGLTQQGREDLIEKRMMKSPEYRDYQFSTTAMDAVLGVIQEDMKISGQ